MKLLERPGKITNSELVIDDHGFLVFAITFQFERGSVQKNEAAISMTWIEESKPKDFLTFTQLFLKDILKLLRKAKSTSTSELIGKKVICYFDCCSLKRWRFI